MKLNGINGTGSGKLGAAVWSVRGGQQIVRQYQSDVANPNTQGQIESRSKMKLLSQLAAVASPVIAIPSEGLKSSRNLFISKNYELAGYDDDFAYIQLPDVQLTNSVISNPGFAVDRSSNVSINVELLQDSTNQFDRVIYVAFVRDYNGSLRLWDTAVATSAGADGLFAASLKYAAGTTVLYCYGIRDNSEAARTRFGNMHTISAESIAKVITSKTLTLADITLSDTAGIQLNTGEDEGQSGSATSVSVRVTAATGGSAAGGGRKEIGQVVTLTATANEGYRFTGWKNMETNQIVSTENPYTFSVADSIELQAQFEQSVEYSVSITQNLLHEDEDTVASGILEVRPFGYITDSNYNQITFDSLSLPQATLTVDSFDAGQSEQNLYIRLNASTSLNSVNSITATMHIPAIRDAQAYDEQITIPVVIS